MSTYEPDLRQFSLARLRTALETGYVLPSHKILTEDIPQRFATLEAQRIKNLQELWEVLGTPKKLQKFSKDSGLSEEYLTILRRKVKGYIPNPNNFKEIPGIDTETVERLEAAGIKHTKHLFERAATKVARAELCAQTGISPESMQELVGLADISRAGWVGPIFCRLFYEAGVHSIQELEKLSAEDLYYKLNEVNQRYGVSKGAYGVRDVAACIELARDLHKTVEY